jgi:thiamine biosynthesis protein ThiS
MIIRINGAEMKVANDASVNDLVTAREMENYAIVMLNGNFIPRELWLTTLLHLKDSLEFIEVIEGG